MQHIVNNDVILVSMQCFASLYITTLLVHYNIAKRRLHSDAAASSSYIPIWCRLVMFNLNYSPRVLSSDEHTCILIVY